jgi:outer membrane protein TolC
MFSDGADPMFSELTAHQGSVRTLGFWVVLLALSSPLQAAPQPGRLTLSYTLQRVPVEASAAPPTLSADQAVRSALTESLSMRSAVTLLQLQGQRLSGVSRAEFLPKLGTTAGVLRSGSRVDGVSQSSAQAQAGLDINWRLKTGAEIKVTNSWARNQLAGSSASESGGAPWLRSTSVSISQPLLKGAGRVVNEARWVAAESAFRVATRSLEQVASNLVAQVLNAYLAVQQAQAATRQAQTAYALAQQVNDLNAALVEAGRSPRNVLLQSALDVSSARLGVAQAENSQRQAVRALERAMGRSDPFDSPDVVVNQPLDAQDDGPLPDEQALVEAALQNSADLLAARENVLLAESALEVARDGLLPALAVSVGSEWTPSAASTARNGPNHFVGLSMNYSFDRAPARLEERAALANLETARAQLADVERQVRDSAIDGLRNLRFALEQRSLMREAFALASQQLDAEVTRQRLGRISPLELSSAQQALAAANRQLLDASRDVFLSRINLALTDGSLLTTWGAQAMVSEWIAQAQTESNR